MKKEIKIPSIIGLILLVVSIIAGVYLTGNKIAWGSKAGSNCQPINLQITNITHNSFDVFFTTSVACQTTLLVNDRTFNNNQTSSKIHYFSVDNLKESSKYQFSIIGNGISFAKESYQINTAQKPQGTIPISNLAWGRVFYPDKKAAASAVVFLIIPGAGPLSAQVNQDGNWNISLANSLNDRHDSWFVPPNNLSEEITVLTADFNPTQITGHTSRNNPVPDITIGQDDIFTANTITPTVNNQFNQTTPVAEEKKLKINNPLDNENLSTRRPDFFGTAPVGSKLIIKVESPTVYTGETIGGNDGYWNWSPPTDLTSGEHTITVSSTDPKTGLIETISRKFTVLAQSDDSIAFSSSPSASLITPTIIPTIMPTETPIITTPTTIVTIRSAKPSTSAAVPVTGIITPTLLPIITGFLLIFFAYFLLQ